MTHPSSLAAELLGAGKTNLSFEVGWACAYMYICTNKRDMYMYMYIYICTYLLYMLYVYVERDIPKGQRLLTQLLSLCKSTEHTSSKDPSLPVPGCLRTLHMA